MSMRRLICVVALAGLFGMAPSPLPLGASAAAAALPGAMQIPISGTVNDATESVALSGSAEIVSTLVLDPLLFEPPRVLVDIRLVGVSGVGLTTGQQYVASGQKTLLRVLGPSDVLEITFPSFPATVGGERQARSVLAAFRLSVDVLTGTLSGATAAFSTPPAAP